jgi:hypothetical protein
MIGLKTKRADHRLAIVSLATISTGIADATD